MVNYQSSLYILQQLFNRLLYAKIYFYSPIFIFFVFFSGIVTSLNPCMISISPIILTYLNTNNENYLNILFFIIGLLSTEITLLYLASIIGYSYYFLSTVVPLISAILCIVIGLIFLQVLFINIEISVSNCKLFNFSNMHMKNFGLGILLGLNTATCTFPIMLTILNILLASKDSVMIFLYGLIYMLGYLITIILFYVLFKQMKDAEAFRVSILNRLSILLGGFFLISFGVFKILKVFFYNFK